MAFKVGVPVEFPDFIDRKQALKMFLHFLQDGQNVMIHAPRRYGKTSLIAEGYRQYNGNTIYFDLKRYADLATIGRELIDRVYEIVGITGFWDSIKDSIANFLKSLRATVSIKLFEIIEISIEKIEKLEQDANKDEIFLYALEIAEKLATNANEKINIAFDEFQDIGISLSKDKLILDKIRAVIQHHKNIMYIFCGSHQVLMNEIFLGKDSPFFHFCRIIELGPLDLKELFEYVKAQFTKIKVLVDDKELTHYLEKLDCHPYYSMKVMQVLYYIAIDDDIKQITDKDYQLAINKAIYETKSYLDEMITQIKNRAHHFEILTAIANGQKIENMDIVAVYKIKQSLVYLGYLKHWGKGEYTFADTFLKYYLTQNTFKPTV